MSRWHTSWCLSADTRLLANATVPLFIHIPKLPAEVLNVATTGVVAEMRRMHTVVVRNMLMRGKDNVAAGEHDCVALACTALHVLLADRAVAEDSRVCPTATRYLALPDAGR